MTTDLFAVASSLDTSAVAEAIPPECRRGVDSSGTPRIEDGHVVLDLAPWVPREPAVHFVPAVSVLGALDYSVRFDLRVASGDRWSPWIATATLGEAGFPDAPSACDALTCHVDVFLAAAPAERVRLRVRIAADDPAAVLRSPWLVTLSASGPMNMGGLEGPPKPPGRSEAARGTRAAPRVHDSFTPLRLSVPAWSQMNEPGPDRLRICSPTSVAMVLGYWGHPVVPAALAAEVFHPSLDRYGLWPAAIRAAGLHGVPGYLLRFPSWEAAAWCLARGLPIVASLRWRLGELAGAPLDETDGHLVVLTGYAGEDVLVNDPAAPSHAEVPRRYRRAEFERAWLGGSGVGYVFFLLRHERPPALRRERPPALRGGCPPALRGG